MLGLKLNYIGEGGHCVFSGHISTVYSMVMKQGHMLDVLLYSYILMGWYMRYGV